MKYVLALDQGTTSSRAIVFDRTGQAMASAQQEFRQIFPQPGWVEHDPEELYASVLHAIVDVLADAERDLTRAQTLARTGDQLREEFAGFYAGAPFVRVVDGDGGR